jgi:hypothetical protein
MRVYYSYKRGLCTDKISGDVIVNVASYFYRIVCDIVLEYLIGKVQKLKKPMDNLNIGVSDRS